MDFIHQHDLIIEFAKFVFGIDENKATFFAISFPRSNSCNV